MQIIPENTNPDNFVYYAEELRFTKQSLKLMNILSQQKAPPSTKNRVSVLFLLFECRLQPLSTFEPTIFRYRLEFISIRTGHTIRGLKLKANRNEIFHFSFHLERIF